MFKRDFNLKWIKSCVVEKQKDIEGRKKRAPSPATAFNKGGRREPKKENGLVRSTTSQILQGGKGSEGKISP